MLVSKGEVARGRTARGTPPPERIERIERIEPVEPIEPIEPVDAVEPSDPLRAR